MRNFIIIRSTIFLLICLAAMQGVAQTPNWRTNRQARTVVNRLVVNTANFQREVQRSRYPWENQTTNADERLSNMVTAFATALDSLKTSVNAGNDAKRTFHANA